MTCRARDETVETKVHYMSKNNSFCCLKAVRYHILFSQLIKSPLRKAHPHLGQVVKDEEMGLMGGLFLLVVGGLLCAAGPRGTRDWDKAARCAQSVVGRTPRFSAMSGSGCKVAQLVQPGAVACGGLSQAALLEVGASMGLALGALGLPGPAAAPAALRCIPFLVKPLRLCIRPT